jgi:hypothetical protein
MLVDLLDFHGVSRTVLEARIHTLVRLIGILQPQLPSADRELVEQCVREQLESEQTGPS